MFNTLLCYFSNKPLATVTLIDNTYYILSLHLNRLHDNLQKYSVKHMFDNFRFTFLRYGWGFHTTLAFISRSGIMLAICELERGEAGVGAFSHSLNDRIPARRECTPVEYLASSLSTLRSPVPD